MVFTCYLCIQKAFGKAKAYTMADKTIQRFKRNMQENAFLFQQLVNRDFTQRYKRTVLGIAWSVLSPMFQLLVMMIVFSRLFGRGMEHYVIYLFSGNIAFSYFSESTTNGMQSLMNNSGILSKINVPKYLFVLSQNVSALINYIITILLFFVFCLADGVKLTPAILTLWYPVVCFVIMNVGIGMVLSALYIFFRDIQYLYRIALTLISYLSVIFYTIDSFSPAAQRLFLLNPIYANIKFWRLVVLEQTIPSLSYHLLLAFYALLFLGFGAFFYKKYNHRFVYYF